MILELTTGEKNKILRAKSKPINVFDDELKQLIGSMQETLVSTEIGIGLAAPQVGKNIQLFVIAKEFEEQTDGHLVFINPEITDYSQEKANLEEGCLSLPDVWHELERPKKVTIKAQDENGEKFKIRAKGLLARLFCHEVDHLGGKLFIDHLPNK